MMKVSVCMATYNGEKFLPLQIESILNQLSDSDELIISDDFSTDRTLEIIKSYKDNRIKLLINSGDKSVTNNFENALKAATGTIVFLSDQDDVWYPNKINKMVSHLSGFDLVVSNCDFIDEFGNMMGKSFFDDFNAGPGFIKNFIKNTFLGNCIAFNKSILQEALPFPKELHMASKYLLFHDVWIGLLASTKFKVLFIPNKLSAFRRHSSNASPTNMGKKSPQPLFNKLAGRILLIIALSKRLTRIQN